MMMKCTRWNKVIFLVFIFLIQLHAHACSGTMYLSCFDCDFKPFLQYIEKRASSLGSTTCYVEIRRSAKFDQARIIVLSFTQDTKVVPDILTFGVVDSKSCLIVLSGEDESTLFKKIPSRHKRVKVFNKPLIELNDGDMESFVFKDGSIFKQDWIKDELVPIEGI